MDPSEGRYNDKPIEMLSTREGYDRWSAIYDGEGNPLIELEEPLVAAWLGDPRGLAIADVGCGTGRHAVRLARAGADVTALDFSDGMVRRAEEKPGWDRVRFVAHDLTHPLPLADRSFDRVLSCLVVDHIADLEALLRELGRICRHDGFVVMTTMHPAMMLRGTQARFTDPATGVEVRPASYPYQIADYVMAVVRSGLRLAEMREHAVDEALAERAPRARKYMGWPMLLAMRLGPG